MLSKEERARIDRFTPSMMFEAVEGSMGDARAYVDERIRERDQRSQMVYKSLSEKIDGVKALALSSRRTLDNAGKRKSSARDILVKSIVARLVATALKRGEAAWVAEEIYGNGSGKIVDAVRDPIGWLRKSVSNPAMTSIAGWAAEVTGSQAIYPGVLATIAPTSIYAALKARGISANLEGVPSIRFPARQTPGGAIASPFVGEGQPIPVRNIDLTNGGLLMGHKCAVMSMYTSELARASVPSIESIVRTGLAEDTALAIDTVLLGTATATAISPAGLLNGVTPLTASASADPATAAAADLAALAAAIVPAAASPVYIMNSSLATSAALLLPGATVLDIIVSDTVSAKQVICLDSSDFVSAVDAGSIETTDDATIVADTAPLPLSTGTSGAGALTAAPHQSLWQLDLVGVRLIEDVSWAMRRAGRVSFVQSVKW